MDVPLELVGQLTPSQLRYKVYYLVSFWIESPTPGLRLLRQIPTSSSGFYFCLFVAAVNIMLRKRTLNMTSSRVFLAGITVMFIIITFHNCSNIYSMVKAYAYGTTLAEPVTILRDLDNWFVFAFPLILSLVIWIADILVTYRCWLIWQRNYWVIIVPSLLLLASIIVHSINLAWFATSNRALLPIVRYTSDANFPLHFVQNIITTGLISFKIWYQHSLVRRVGVVVNGGLNLMNIVRIIIESALIYTITMLIMVILFLARHPAAVIFQHALVPITGMVFLLVAIRTHSARGDQAADTVDVIPSWMHKDGEDDSSTHKNKGHPSRGHMPIFVTTVTEEHRHDHMTSSVRFDDGRV
ncbi:hypothetical protein FA15DRAFT_730831 [Coprinopsis marcescibilis]|uniref:Uncharacterized protein n=1 Tax=Coprinopsis marcescibilis TaxID=230819 RepID=A0A5C3KEJ7_COPMA|nr:hypothetical protein FA15DRAFT_730831 [Coprinopsis marcescibilis]